jgi:hypothetical protein
MDNAIITSSYDDKVARLRAAYDAYLKKLERLRHERLQAMRESFGDLDQLLIEEVRANLSV